MAVYRDAAGHWAAMEPSTWMTQYDVEVYGNGAWTLYHNVNREVAQGWHRTKLMRSLAIYRAIRRDTRDRKA